MYHDKDIRTVLESIGSSAQGLTAQEAQARLIKYGANELRDEKKVSRLILFLSQFKSFLIIILLAAGAVSALLKEFVDAAAIILIVILTGVLGFIQEYRAERAIEALKRMAAPTARVIRNGKAKVIPSRDLVPGDIIILLTGDLVPADARLIEALNLKVNEASLTGESAQVEKSIVTLPEDTGLSGRKNMVYLGTSVSYGRGKAAVTATGMQTELGRIAGMLGEIERAPTPLQKNLDRLGRWIGIITIAVVLFVSAIGVASGFGLFDMFIWGVALAVAAVPEALPAVVTVCLALGVRRMAKRHALVRKLPSVETLGATTVICSDKTGTLTKDEMTAVKIYTGGRLLDVTGVGYEPYGEFYDSTGLPVPKDEEHLRMLLLICALCNDSELIDENGWRIRGDQTEGAFAVAAAKGGIHRRQVEELYKRVNEIPFSSERKRMTTIHATPKGLYAYSKGAPEVILDSCTWIYRDAQVSELGRVEKDDILKVVQEMADKALRVMAFAYKQVSSVEDAEHEMVFAGLMGMIDPPREEAKEAIEKCTKAGIKVVMITGDHQSTAQAVARELGLIREGETVLNSAELDKMNDRDLEHVVENVSVYARITSAHKMRIIDAFKKKGHVVAMTGDGVNDAPALKKADIGVAMGITGTDVSKEASDMILTDDNFSSIVAAVEEGRNIFKNIRNFVLYGLTTHSGEVLTVLFAMLAFKSLPLIAVQILWINLITDGLPPMALSVEPPHKGIMRLPPRSQKEGIITKRVLLYSLFVGILIALQALALFRWQLESSSLVKAQTMVFTLIVFSEMFNAFNWRSDRHSVFSIGLFSNKPLIYAVTSTIVLQLAVIYIPFLNDAFSTAPLELEDWMLILALASTTLILVEAAKFTEQRL
jgi:Ca2+-transporting ATPase